VLAGKVENRDVELVLNADGKVTRGQCNCSHWFQFKLRAGPCRHQQALRRAANGEATGPDAGAVVSVAHGTMSCLRLDFGFVISDFDFRKVVG